jgi:hypothetical protein
VDSQPVAGLAIDPFVDPGDARGAVATEALAPHAAFVEVHPADDGLPARFADHAVGAAVRAGGGGFLLPAKQLVLAHRGAVADAAAVAGRPGAARNPAVGAAEIAAGLLRAERRRHDQQSGAERAERHRHAPGHRNRGGARNRTGRAHDTGRSYRRD